MHYDLSVGQVSRVHWRYAYARWLPYMNQYQKVMTTALPKVIANYETLFLPFDRYIWISLLISCAFEFAFLFSIDWLWQRSLWVRKKDNCWKAEGLTITVPAPFFSLKPFIAASKVAIASIASISCVMRACECTILTTF